MSGEPVRELVHEDAEGRSFIRETHGNQQRIVQQQRPIGPLSVLAVASVSVLGGIVSLLSGKR